MRARRPLGSTLPLSFFFAIAVPACDDGAPAAEGEGWVGTASGEVFRRSIDAEGSKTFEFQALIGGEVSLARNGAEVEARDRARHLDDRPGALIAAPSPRRLRSRP
jgi:hypothetical protein